MMAVALNIEMVVQDVAIEHRSRDDPKAAAAALAGEC